MTYQEERHWSNQFDLGWEFLVFSAFRRLLKTHFYNLVFLSWFYWLCNARSADLRMNAQYKFIIISLLRAADIRVGRLALGDRWIVRDSNVANSVSNLAAEDERSSPVDGDLRSTVRSGSLAATLPADKRHQHATKILSAHTLRWQIDDDDGSGSGGLAENCEISRS